jgi:signal transduction histidine kinase
MKFDSAYLFDRPPRTLAVAYLCLGALFVPLGDFAVAFAVGTTGMTGTTGLIDAWTPVRLVGGWLFVGVSSLLLYGVAAHHRRRAVSARRKLETSNQQIQVLSRVFRHNVRNDLNIIQGYTDLLVDRVDGERSQECLETIRQTTDNVVAISEKLRVIEDASPDPPTGRIDLVETVREAAAEVDGDGVCVSVEAPSVAWICADRSVEYPIREVFENAVTHNDEVTCEVVARIEATETTTCLEVSDNGPGIPDDERAVLRAEEETPLSHASSIGLWLVKWMCETQGGTVGFETTDDGTTVRLRFESAGTDASPPDHDTERRRVATDTDRSISRRAR